MPIVNGKYESPIWENNQPPAMDAAEMQAITDSVEESIHALGDYTTPAQKMGLTGDLSVGASLGVLANIGNVHVWRKTVVTEEEIPAGYRLVDDTTNRNNVGDQTVSNALIFLIGDTTAELKYSTEITVNENGVVNLNSVISTNSVPSPVTVLNGKYIQLRYSFGKGPVNLDTNKIYYIPSDATVTLNSNNNGWILVNKLQYVDAYPAVPPGTHVTYLTSTNRNAYQEGDDAKEAGYVLGDMVSGYLFASAWTGNASNYYYSETIKVSDTGTLTQENVKSYTANATNDSWVSNIQSAIRGKFITVSGEKDNGGSEGTNLVYIPDDAIVSYFENGVSLGYPYNYGFLVSKMQQVTGYPAIPAGTTIDYLGVLGEKVSVETGSYTGTGTYGSSNLNTIHLSRTPKLVFITPYNGANRMMLFVFGGNSSFSGYSGSASLSYQQIVSDGTDFSWYANNADIQLNNSGTKYVYTAVI